ncbi:MAG TPA: NAD(P)-dependent oxidoreductase [Acidimicrobiales bacterium]|nr:NAD(P)-dependent oxidoreductase [Acidimicrobiales bacterium]
MSVAREWRQRRGRPLSGPSISQCTSMPPAWIRTMHSDVGLSSVGLIGVGTMGGAFARHLVDAGFGVVAHDADPSRVIEGTTPVASVAEVVGAGVEVVLLSLPSDDAFAAVVGELKGALLVVDTSTLSLPAKEAGRARLAAVGVTLLDCPVSGTGAQALAGDLVVYASGPDDALDACAPVLAAFSRAVHRVGPFGAGSKMKYLANLLVTVHTAAAAEVLALAERAGVDPAHALATIRDGAGQSRMLEVRGPSMATHDYGFGATVELFVKDMRIIRAFAADAGASTPLLDVAARLYEEAARAGWRHEEAAAVHRLYLGEA